MIFIPGIVSAIILGIEKSTNVISALPTDPDHFLCQPPTSPNRTHDITSKQHFTYIFNKLASDLIVVINFLVKF
jgi:hypothetical protein